MQLYRSIRARDLFDIFFVSAVTSLLSVRLFLSATGYPQVGGDGLHIAHMLWGGFLMLVAMTILLGFIGRRSQQLSAILGGAGFGVFIDEIGKFITSDNDYFFRPAVGIIYAIFVILYLSLSFVSRSNELSSREYQLNALMEFEEAVSRDMDETEKARVKALLLQSDTSSPVTRQLLALLDSVKTIRTPGKSMWRRVLAKSDQLYTKFWQQQNSNNFVRIFFIGQAILLLVILLAVQFASIDDIASLFRGDVGYGTWLLVGEIVSALAAAAIVARGAYILPVSRLRSFELFRQAALVNIFLTEFFSFSRIQFEALPGFGLSLVLLIGIGYAINQERRLDIAKRPQK